MTVLVGDGNDIALEVFQEVVGGIVVEDTADTVFVIVQGNQGVVAPGFAEDLYTIQRIGVLYPVNGLTGTDAIGVVGIGVAVKRLELSALFLRQVFTPIFDEVASIQN